MKILFLDSPAFAKQDMIDAFEAKQISCDLFFHKDYKERKSKDFEAAFDIAIEKASYAFVFSFNYCPVLSTCCQKHGIKYVSYVYDSPLAALYSCTLIHSCNYVFLFDKSVYLTFKNAGINTVYYLPLAANVSRLSSLVCPTALREKISGDVAFVGSLYNEGHNFFDRLDNISDFTRGYLDAIMRAQQHVYGSFFLEELLTPEILSDLQKSVPYSPMPDGTESPAYVYANYFLCRKITARERIAILQKLSNAYALKLYTHNPSPELPHAEFMGTVDWYSVMPLIFRSSRISLNITLKSIHTGIPLRCMDIMGSGGFLLTNYQEELLDFFQPEEDFVYYESEDDCVQKVGYYLTHEAERQQIAANAVGKMAERHTFCHRVETILNTLFC